MPTADLVHTTDWGYVRLREEDYTAKTLRRWIDKIRTQDWKEAYVFFKHEGSAAGPELATRFLELTQS